MSYMSYIYWKLLKSLTAVSPNKSKLGYSREGYYFGAEFILDLYVHKTHNKIKLSAIG